MPNVLVVDDNASLLELYEQELKDEGYCVAKASNASDAIEFCRTHTPDAVIMDIAMPGMDGIAAMRTILSRGHVVPIILNTAFSQYESAFESWPASAYVVKSGDLTELKNKLRKVLDAYTVNAK